MDRFTRRIAVTSARHPWRTVAAWILVMGAMLFLGAGSGSTFTDDFASPGSQSARAMDLLEDNFPEAAKGKAMVVFAAEDGGTLESHREAIASVLTEVAALDHVESVTDPFVAGTVSEDGRIGFAELTLDRPEREIGKPAFTVLSEAVAGSDVPGVQVELGGDAVFLNSEDDSSGHTGIGLLVALLVLLVVFGTLVAAI
ncbi:MAG TPA: MMPL family transporter, partial [Nocardioides sp.]|nr:MMPL family transporter [Nocardioides sp.]